MFTVLALSSMEVSATVIELRPTANANQFTRTHVVADTREEPVGHHAFRA